MVTPPPRLARQFCVRFHAHSILSALQVWRFMRKRIEVEDRLLLKFFGEEWQRWRDDTPSGLPGIP